ncbi:hypothetical protein [Ferruginibacter profundus]
MSKTKRGYLLFFLFIVITLYIAYRQTRNLENNFLVTNGYVENMETFPQNIEVFVTYSYIINGKKLKNKSSIPFSKKSDISFINNTLLHKSLPVIYEKGNIENSMMLFTKTEFLKYKISNENN